jgi:hypothetical protein
LEEVEGDEDESWTRCRTGLDVVQRLETAQFSLKQRLDALMTVLNAARQATEFKHA